jgi:hypothetical protein
LHFREPEKIKGATQCTDGTEEEQIYLIREYTAIIRPRGANVYAKSRTVSPAFVFANVDQAPPRCRVNSREANVAYPTALMPQFEQ